MKLIRDIPSPSSSWAGKGFTPAPGTTPYTCDQLGCCQAHQPACDGCTDSHIPSARIDLDPNPLGLESLGKDVLVWLVIAVVAVCTIAVTFGIAGYVYTMWL